MPDPISMKFDSTFHGTASSPVSTLTIGGSEGEWEPYHLLFSALGSCFYATFLDIVAKKRLHFDGATLSIEGVKRSEVPTTLETVTMHLKIMNPSNELAFQKSAELGAKYCSIHETISKVATMHLEVTFEKK